MVDQGRSWRNRYSLICNQGVAGSTPAPGTIANDWVKSRRWIGVVVLQPTDIKTDRLVCVAGGQRIMRRSRR